MRRVIRRRPPTQVQPFHAWDVLLVLTLTMIALVGWESTFSGQGWWITGGVAAVIGVAVATGVVAARGGVEVVVLVLAFAYFFAGGPIVERELRLTDLSILESGVRASADVWSVLLGTHPPVDSSGAALLAPVLLALFSAGVGAALALRSTRAALPLAPPTLVLAVVLLLAQPEPVSVVLQGVGFGVVAMMWMRLRGLRIDEAAHGRDPARAWRMVGSIALILAAALTASAFAGDPAPGERFVLSRQMPPYDAGREATPLDSFRDFTEPAPGQRTPEDNVHDHKLLTLRGAPEGVRVRFAALGDYDGNRWQAANDNDPAREDDRFLRLSSTIDNPANGRQVRVAVDPTGDYASRWVPTIGAVQSFSFFGSAREDAQSHLRYDPASQTALMDDGLEKNDTYAFTTAITGGLLKRRMTASTLVDPGLSEAGAFLDPAIETWAFGAVSPVDAVFRVAARLKRVGRYSDGAIFWQSRYTAGHGTDRLGDGFVLGEPTAGNDEQYAAAMALMANRLGAPARVVVGAVLRASGVVRGRDVQAWVEVRIADGSWRTLPTETFMGNRAPRRGGVQATLPPRAFPDPPAQPQPQPEIEEEPAPEPPTPPPAADADDASGGVPWGLVLLALALGAPVVVPAVKGVRRRRRLGARRVTLRYAGAWLELVDHARDLGVPVAPGLTRPAEARAVGAVPQQPSGEDSGDRSGDTLVDLAREADRRIYAADSPGAADADAFWSLVRAQRATLGTQVAPWRRAWAVFSPASLRRGGHGEPPS